MKVIKKVLTGASEAFTFDEPVTKFLVKNFTDSDIFVGFEEITNENKGSTVKILTKMSEIILDNEFNPDGHKSVYVLGTGAVEVQAVLDYLREKGKNNVMLGQSYISKL